jgi:hypothetical protein
MDTYELHRSQRHSVARNCDAVARSFVFPTFNIMKAFSWFEAHHAFSSFPSRTGSAKIAGVRARINLGSETVIASRVGDCFG